MLRLILPLLLLAAPVQARTIDVSTGEHDGFTRVVLNLPDAAGWRLGRTAKGYALQIAGAEPTYNLARAFDRITDDRIAALRPAREGLLEIDIACRCHAIPFEFRSDMLVIDIRDGAPPPGSAFELGLGGAPLLPLGDTTAGRDRADDPATPAALDWSRDWLTARRSMPNVIAAEPLQLDDPQALLDLSQLRETLLMEFSRAAADGLVDPVEKPVAPALPPTRSATGDANIRIGETLTARPVTRPEPPLTSSGDLCPAPEDLAVGTWGDDRPATVQLAEAMSRLLGEFDRPDAEAVAQAVRLHLHFGFGAEATQLLTVFPTGRADEPLLRSMARILDGQPDPAGPFATFAACDGPAALWSALADPGRLSPMLDRAAALRSFSSLPPHLRRSLGPALAESFLATDDIAAATEVLEAILRHPGAVDERTTILMARLALVTGGTDTAEARLQAVMSDPGPEQAAALIALVDLHLAERRPIDPQVAETLAAYRAESGGTPSAALIRAHALALALSGDVGAALTEAADADLRADLWAIVAHGPDDALLRHAIGADPTQARPVDRARMSERFVALGFLTEAQRWAVAPGPITLPAPEEDRLASALRARDWANLPDDAPPVWADVTERLRAPDTGTDPPLAQATGLADQSAETRAAVAALLETVPRP